MNRLMRMPTRRVPPRPGDTTVAAAPPPTAAPPFALRPPPAGCATITCDQAVFTSQRSALGEGYRIIAHGGGLTHRKKAELTRRSPSHGSLARDDADAFGLLAMPLAGGRVAVAHCVYAGAEHTGRGGQRVWSHYAVLDEAAFDAFGKNPMRVQRAMAIQTAPQPSLAQSLPRLELPAWRGADADDPPPAGAMLEVQLRLIDLCLMRGRWAVAGLACPTEALEWAWDLVPPCVRGRLSLSCGLGFCLGREVHITVVDSVRSGVERMIRGHDVHLRDLTQPDAPLGSPHVGWIDLIRAWAPRRRWSRVAALAGRIEGEGETLNRIARLCLDLDRAELADDEAKADLHERYLDFTPECAVEQELLAQLLAATEPPPEPDEESEDVAS